MGSMLLEVVDYDFSNFESAGVAWESAEVEC